MCNSYPWFGFIWKYVVNIFKYFIRIKKTQNVFACTYTRKNSNTAAHSHRGKMKDCEWQSILVSPPLLMPRLAMPRFRQHGVGFYHESKNPSPPESRLLPETKRECTSLARSAILADLVLLLLPNLSVRCPDNSVLLGWGKLRVASNLHSAR